MDELHRIAERTEADFMALSAPRSHGVSMLRVGTGVAMAAKGDVTHFWTRAFGFTERLTGADIDAILDFYRTAGVPGAVLQLAPWTLPPEWPEIVAAHGLTEHSTWTKLGAKVDDVQQPGDTDLLITEVGPDQAGDWAAVIRQGFGVPRELTPALAASVGLPGARHFVAWDRDEPVGASCLFVENEVGYLTTTATLKSHRNRGVQSAMIGRRVKEAADCRWVVAETGLPGNGEKNPSLNNMLRAGLKPLHQRRNWYFTASAARCA